MHWRILRKTNVFLSVSLYLWAHHSFIFAVRLFSGDKIFFWLHIHDLLIRFLGKYYGTVYSQKVYNLCSIFVPTIFHWLGSSTNFSILFNPIINWWFVVIKLLFFFVRFHIDRKKKNMFSDIKCGKLIQCCQTCCLRTLRLMFISFCHEFWWRRELI